MVPQTVPTKKLYFYNFFPTKAEEELLKASEDTAGGGKIHGRILIEMLDMHPPHVANPDDPWRIKKTLNCYEVLSGRIVMSSTDMFEYVMRYWSLGMASYAALGHGVVGVTVCDVTEEGSPAKYENSYVTLTPTMENNSFALSCMELMKKREVKVGDVVYLYWDINDMNFKFKFKVAGCVNS